MKASPSFFRLVTTLLVTAGIAALVLVELDNARLRRAIARRHTEAPAVAALRSENAQLMEWHHAAKDTVDPARLMREQVAAARTEVARLERAAELAHLEATATDQADAESLATSRDPTRAMTRAEQVAAKGQSTPQDAFQTAVWAAMKGDEATIAKVCGMTPATKAQADQLIARLPEAARHEWTPEKLMALWLVAEFNEIPAVQLTGESYSSADSATVRFRIYGQTDEEHVNLKLRPAGWQLTLPSNAIEKIEQGLQAKK